MKWVIRGGDVEREVDVQRHGEGYEITVDGEPRRVELVRLDGAFASLRYPDNGRSFQITYHHGANGSWRVGVGQREFDLAVLSPSEAVEAVSGGRESGPSRLKAPIPGKVVAVKVAPGDEVVPGQSLVVLEAMKMENELAAEQAGRVTAIHVADGDTVESGQLLVEIE
jgi:3-methylcrotonyl-CoA carboxylase alpha subunit